jgi:hypothetical protein
MVVIENKLARRIRDLADKNHKSFNQQLELMVETFEIMTIQKLSYLPRPIGGHQVPMVEVAGQLIQRGQIDE